MIINLHLRTSWEVLLASHPVSFPLASFLLASYLNQGPFQTFSFMLVVEVRMHLKMFVVGQVPQLFIVFVTTFWHLI